MADGEGTAGGPRPILGCQVAFPISAATGAAASAVVSFESPPGGRLGCHIDSAVGTARLGRVGADPSHGPHNLHNGGTGPVSVLGFFAGAARVYRFAERIRASADEVVFLHGIGPPPPDRGEHLLNRANAQPALAPSLR